MKTKTQDPTQGHTPGPWVASKRVGEQWGIQAKERNWNHVALVSHLTLETLPTGESEANAALIAQAPKLKADRDVLLEAAKYTLHQAGIDPVSPSYKKLRAAISQAEGK